MKPKYYETVTIEKINLWDSTILKIPSEGNVILRLINKSTKKEISVDCFVHKHDEIRKWQILKPHNTVSVRLVLLNWNYNKTRPIIFKRKVAKQKRSYEYKIQGEVLEISPYPDYDDSLLVIIDCGVYIETRIGKNLDLKVGDYISAEGRLDAYILGKVN